MLSLSHKSSNKVFSNQAAESPTSDFDDFQQAKAIPPAHFGWKQRQQGKEE
jgi:hypothetical protein